MPLSGSIPRTAHVIWVGPPTPAHLVQMHQRFRELHPDWRVTWWDEERIDALGLTNRDVYDAANDIVPADSANQLRSDVARYEILHRFGGLYVDLDYVWQRAVDPLLADTTLFTAWELQDRFVANNIIAATPGHPIFADIISDIPERVRTRHRSWRANRITGPHPWTDAVLRRRSEAVIAPQELFCPVAWNEPERADTDTFPDAFAVHQWQHQRDIRGL